MRLWLASKWEDIRTSFWFMPTLMVAAAVALPLATIHLDRATPRHNWVATLGWTFTRGPLAAVAGTMMTITSVTLSITVVALQLASSQFSPRRTLVQDVEFAIDQLVEVTVRALSPGVNDPFTAISCIARLGAALCTLAEKVIPSPYRHDEDGRLHPRRRQGATRSR
jgi:uncharacterized membrane protein